MVEDKIKKTADFKKLEITDTLEWVGVSLSKYDLRQKLIRSASSLMFQADVIQRYLIGDVLGMGSYGIVKQCIDSITLRRSAVKMFVAKRIRRIPHGPEDILNEMRIMRKIDHENVVKTFSIMKRDEDHFMMIELCKCNLDCILDRMEDKKLPLIVAHHFFNHLARGVDYLQSIGIIHMDIKPDNMLISYDNVLKISDFGVAKQLDMFQKDDTCNRYRGCPIIQPPEVARGDDTFSGFKLDIWCSGVTLFKIVTGYYPYDAANEFLLIEKILNKVYTIPNWLDEKVASLIKSLLQFKAENRPTIKQVIHNSWLQTAYPDLLLENALNMLDIDGDDSTIIEMLHKFDEGLDDDATNEPKEEVIRTIDFLAFDKST